LLAGACARTLTVFNESPAETVEVWYVPPQGELVSSGTIGPGDRLVIDTHPEHQFLAKWAGEDEELGRYVVDANFHFQLWTIRDRSLASSKCQIWGGKKAYKKCFLDLPSHVLTEERFQSARNKAIEDRLTMIDRQPKAVPKFTEIGFKKTKIPSVAYDMIKFYYNVNRVHAAREKFSFDDSVINYWATPTYMTPIPMGTFANIIASHIKPVISEWSNVPAEELDFTFLYGVRTYLNDSILENHVDRVLTHVLSAILNIDSDPKAEPWPLEIYSHDGQKHEILMEPGDMVLYESAACVHGRPTPFKGKYYSNVFIHFKPNNPQRWPYTNDLDFRS